MHTLADVLFAATAAAYLAASVVFIAFLAGGAQRALWWGPRLVAIGVPLHAAQICVWSLVLHVCPVEGIHFALSVVAMLVCVVYVLARLRLRVDVVGAFVAPQALAFLLASRFVGPVDAEPRLRGALLPFHVASNLLGIALFTLAFAAAVAYLRAGAAPQAQAGSTGPRAWPPVDRRARPRRAPLPRRGVSAPDDRRPHRDDLGRARSRPERGGRDRAGRPEGTRPGRSSGACSSCARRPGGEAGGPRTGRSSASG